MTIRKIQQYTILAITTLLISACTAFPPPAMQINHSTPTQAGGRYTVKRGENLYAIAQRNGVRIYQLVELNKLRPPYYLRPGTTIILPAKNNIVKKTRFESNNFTNQQYYSRPVGVGLAGKNSVSSEKLSPLNLSKRSEDYRNIIEETRKPSIEIYDPPANKTLPIAKSYSDNTIPSFTWPVRGTIISTYGPKGKGRDNDGINISAPKGSPVKAAEFGSVVYAGNGMKGFGNLVLIKHKNGWVTAYAHMARLTVKKNDSVKKGDMIGTVGSTGSVSSPQLHFESRRDGVPVDPELVIK